MSFHSKLIVKIHTISLIWISLAIFGTCTSIHLNAEVSGLGKSAVVVYNNNLPESKQVAEHYADRRGVPDDQVIGLDLRKSETITRKDFETTLYQPLYQFLKEKELFRKRIN